MIPNSWYKDLSGPLLHWMGLTCVTSRILWKGWCVTSEARSWKTSQIPLLFLELVTWGKPDTIFQGLSCSCREKTTWQGTDASCQQPARNWDLLSTAVWWAILSTDSPEPLDGCSLGQQLNAAAWKILRHYHSAKLVSNSQFIESGITRVTVFSTLLTMG